MLLTTVFLHVLVAQTYAHTDFGDDTEILAHVTMAFAEMSAADACRAFLRSVH